MLLKTLAIVLILLAANLTMLSAKPIDLPVDKLHLDIPDSWTSGTPGGSILLSAADAQNSADANLLKMPNDRGDGLDEPEFVNGIKAGFTRKLEGQGKSVAITKEGQTTLNGVSFYNLQGTFGASGDQPTRFSMYVTAANGQIYILSLQSMRADADADLQGIANSLRFTTPPVLPDPYQPKTPSDTIGYYVGLFIGVLAVISIFKWIRLRAQRRNGPPPPPPLS